MCTNHKRCKKDFASFVICASNLYGKVYLYLYRAYTNGSVLAAFLLICLQYAETKPTNEKCNNVCNSSGCRNEAELLLKNMNPAADPCDDFFEFACGNFVKNSKIPEDAASIAVLTSMDKELETIIVDLLEKNIAPNDSETVKKLKIHYKNCLDKATVEATGTKPVLDILNSLGGWPVLQTNWTDHGYSWEETIAKISSLGLENKFPIMLFVGDDTTDSSKTNLRIDSAKLTVTESYFSDNGTLLQNYESYMVDIAVLLGANRNVAQKEMKECLDFETKLHKIKLPLAFLQRIHPNFTRMSVKYLSQKLPRVNWLHIINSALNPSNLSLTPNDIVQVIDPKYVNHFEQLLESTPKKTLANFQLWQVIVDLIDYMPQVFDDKKLLFDKIAEGIDKRPNRNTWCVKKVRETLPIAVSFMYVTNFDKKVKDKVSELVDDLKSQIRATIKNLSWMDKATRKAALEKLDGMKATIAYPDQLLDDQIIDAYYTDLEIHPGSFLADYLATNKFRLTDHYRKLRKSTGPSDWTDEANVAVINAYYAFTKNKITLPAGILRGHMFQSDLPKYINYGSTGFVIGHEVIHGFDIIGSNYNKEGNLANWWDANTRNTFNQKAQCMIEQYNNYTVEQIGVKLRGDTTATENMADNGGIKAAYYAYQQWANSNNVREPCLPNIEYTPQQMFWISAANVWCTKVKDDKLRKQVQEDSHSPAIARVSVTFSNMEEFARDFQCKVGSKMNPAKRCSVY